MPRRLTRHVLKRLAAAPRNACKTPNPRRSVQSYRLPLNVLSAASGSRNYPAAVADAASRCLIQNSREGVKQHKQESVYLPAGKRIPACVALHLYYGRLPPGILPDLFVPVPVGLFIPSCCRGSVPFDPSRFALSRLLPYVACVTGRPILLRRETPMIATSNAITKITATMIRNINNPVFCDMLPPLLTFLKYTHLSNTQKLSVRILMHCHCQ